MTSASSASNAGLLTKLSAPSRTCAISACGVPRQSKADSSTLVTMTARTLTALDAGGFHLCIDLVHGHWTDPGVFDAIRNRQQPIGGLLAFDGVLKQSFECFRCQQARFARCLCSGFRQLDLNL